MTGATASRAVLFSGTTFVIALLGLFLVPTNVLRSLAAGAIIVGVVWVAAALTLLPAVLSLPGTASTPCGYLCRHPPRPRGRYRRTDVAICDQRGHPPPGRQPRVVGGLMVLAAVPVLGLHIGQSGIATLPGTLPSKQGYLAVARYFPGQDPNPVEIVTQGAVPPTTATCQALQAILAADPRFGPGPSRPRPTGTCWP